MPNFIDTHCHVHELVRRVTSTYDKWYSDHESRSLQSVLDGAVAADVGRMLTVGTSIADSQLAVETVVGQPELFAVVGIHPHEAAVHLADGTYKELKVLLQGDLRVKKIVGIGEIGLDYYYNHSPKEDQITLLRYQIELALEHNLPISFHVRDAFDDFWQVFDSYSGIRGVVHSFTDSFTRLEQALERGLYVGVNGIATFGKDETRNDVNRVVPLDRLVLETDAPYLTPMPFRGKMCEPKHVRTTAEFLATLRGENLELIASSTTANAESLFALR